MITHHITSQGRVTGVYSYPTSASTMSTADDCLSYSQVLYQQPHKLLHHVYR